MITILIYNLNLNAKDCISLQRFPMTINTIQTNSTCNGTTQPIDLYNLHDQSPNNVYHSITKSIPNCLQQLVTHLHNGVLGCATTRGNPQPVARTRTSTQQRTLPRTRRCDTNYRVMTTLVMNGLRLLASSTTRSLAC